LEVEERGKGGRDKGFWNKGWRDWRRTERKKKERKEIGN